MYQQKYPETHRKNEYSKAKSFYSEISTATSGKSIPAANTRPRCSLEETGVITKQLRSIRLEDMSSTYGRGSLPVCGLNRQTNGKGQPMDAAAAHQNWNRSKGLEGRMGRISNETTKENKEWNSVGNSILVRDLRNLRNIPLKESDVLNRKRASQSINRGGSTSARLYSQRWKEVQGSIRDKAEKCHLNYDALCKNSDEVGKSLPSSRSLNEMKKLPYAWAELYEDEAWTLPQNDLLDRKFHWWQKMDAWWKNTSSHFVKPIYSIASTYIEDSLASLSTMESLSGQPTHSPALFSYGSRSASYAYHFFKQFNALADDTCAPLLSAIHGHSILGSRRAAINQWIVDVALKFHFNSSTYSLCMQLLDSYLEAKSSTANPVCVENPSELMVICVASLLLAAGLREHWYHPDKDAYLNMIVSSSSIKFTHEDVILAQGDILSTVPARLPASYIMFDYCLLFLAELRDVKVEGFLSPDLFLFIQRNGLLLWLFQLLQNANKFVIEECINLRVPGSRVAACLILRIFAEFCGKEMGKDVCWLRLFAHHVLHMYFDGDISFWMRLLQPCIDQLFYEIQVSEPQLKPWFDLWEYSGKQWRALQGSKVDEAPTTCKNLNSVSHMNNSSHLITPASRSKRLRYEMSADDESPMKQRRLPLKLQRNNMLADGIERSWYKEQDVFRVNDEKSKFYESFSNRPATFKNSIRS